MGRKPVKPGEGVVYQLICFVVGGRRRGKGFEGAVCRQRGRFPYASYCLKDEDFKDGSIDILAVLTYSGLQGAVRRAKKKCGAGRCFR